MFLNKKINNNFNNHNYNNHNNHNNFRSKIKWLTYKIIKIFQK